MKPTQEIKDQIRNLAQEEYPDKPLTRTVDALKYCTEQNLKKGLFLKGATAVMERLDIDQAKFLVIMLRYKEDQIDWKEAKQAILEAIRISG